MSAAFDWQLDSRCATNSRCNEGNKRAIHGRSRHRYERASMQQTRKNIACFTKASAQALRLPCDLPICTKNCHAIARSRLNPSDSGQ